MIKYTCTIHQLRSDQLASEQDLRCSYLQTHKGDAAFNAAEKLGHLSITRLSSTC